MSVPIAVDTAKEITNKIKEGLDGLWDLIITAYQWRVWTVLGYETWDDYCLAEFGQSRIKLDRGERMSVVGNLRDHGLSLRAIASATGYDKRTVKRDLDSAQPKPPPVVTGINGRNYSSRTGVKPSSQPVKRKCSDSFWTVSYELGKLAERANKLTGHRDFQAHRERIREDSLPELLRLRAILNEIIGKLEGACV